MNPKLITETGHQRVFALLENHPLRLANSKGYVVKCISGVVLITAYNEPEDFELCPGDVFVVPNNGLALVEGIGDCHVQVDFSCIEPHPRYRLLPMFRLVKFLQRLTGFKALGAYQRKALPARSPGLIHYLNKTNRQQ